MSAGILNALSAYNRGNATNNSIANPQTLNPMSGYINALQLASLFKQLQGGQNTMAGQNNSGLGAGAFNNLTPTQLQLLLHYFQGGGFGGNSGNSINPLSMRT